MRAILVTFLLYCLHSTVFANVAVNEDKTQLLALKTVFEQAVADNQMQRLRPYLAPGFSLVMFTDNEFTDFDVFLQQWQASRERLLQGGRYQMQLQPETTQFINDIALARGNALHQLQTGDGKQFEFSTHWTALLQRIDGQWRLLRIHASTSPFDNPIVKDKVQGWLWQVALGALMLGAALSAALLFWRQRRIARLRPAS